MRLPVPGRTGWCRKRTVKQDYTDAHHIRNLPTLKLMLTEIELLYCPLTTSTITESNFKIVSLLGGVIETVYCYPFSPWSYGEIQKCG